MSEDLWGVLPPPDKTTLPANLLKEQGELLSQKTNGILRADLDLSYTSDDGNDIAEIKFYIQCPALNNYRFGVLTVRYPRFEGFPTQIYYQDSDDPGQLEKVVVDDMEGFKLIVKDILQSNRVKKLISILLRDAQEFDQ